MVDISAVIVTRGNVDLDPILETIPFDDVVIYDNSKRHNYSVYGRYEGILDAKHELIYVQDDDCTVPILDLVDAWDGSMTSVTCNMPTIHGDYTDSALVGWGALFQRDLPFQAFFRWSEFYPVDQRFYRCADIAFTGLTRINRVSVGHYSFDYAYGDDRMYNQDTHDSERRNFLEEVRYVRNFPHPHYQLMVQDGD